MTSDREASLTLEYISFSNCFSRQVTPLTVLCASSAAKGRRVSSTIAGPCRSPLKVPRRVSDFDKGSRFSTSETTKPASTSLCADADMDRAVDQLRCVAAALTEPAAPTQMLLLNRLKVGA